VRSLKDEAEMEAIADALEKTHWCRKDAAKMLGISYKALLYKIRQFGLDTGRPARASSKKVGGGGTPSSGSAPSDLAPAGKHG
jgi:Bacterial regulatory protein, Fis family